MLFHQRTCANKSAAADSDIKWCIGGLLLGHLRLSATVLDINNLLHKSIYLILIMFLVTQSRCEP